MCHTQALKLTHMRDHKTTERWPLQSILSTRHQHIQARNVLQFVSAHSSKKCLTSCVSNHKGKRMKEKITIIHLLKICHIGHIAVGGRLGFPSRQLISNVKCLLQNCTSHSQVLQFSVTNYLFWAWHIWHICSGGDIR